MVEKVLVSACLLGQPVRYNGSAKDAPGDVLARWQREGRVVPVCPELAGGFAVPRPPAEIVAGATGEDVLAGTARVIDDTGRDVTDPFILGARQALALARQHGCVYAVLTDGSPSCGSGVIYDGSFQGRRQAGMGVTTALLRAHGIQVFAQDGIAALDALLSEQ